MQRARSARWKRSFSFTAAHASAFVPQAAVMQLLSEQAFAQQLATGQGPSSGGGEGAGAPGGRRALDRGMLGGGAGQQEQAAVL